MGDRERARAYWQWFRGAPIVECRDTDCHAKLAELLAEVRAEERERHQQLRHDVVAIGIKAQEDGNETIRGMVADALWGDEQRTANPLPRKP